MIKTITIDTDEHLAHLLEQAQEQHRQLIKALKHLQQQLYENLNTLYTALECPHGDNHAGLMKWVTEQAEVAKLLDTMANDAYTLGERSTLEPFERYYQPRIEEEQP